MSFLGALITTIHITILTNVLLIFEKLTMVKLLRVNCITYLNHITLPPILYTLFHYFHKVEWTSFRAGEKKMFSHVLITYTLNTFPSNLCTFVLRISLTHLKVFFIHSVWLHNPLLKILPSFLSTHCKTTTFPLPLTNSKGQLLSLSVIKSHHHTRFIIISKQVAKYCPGGSSYYQFTHENTNSSAIWP